MTATSIPVQQIDDITECSICAEVLVDPRMLPCTHTFCFKCIDKLRQSQNPNDILTCPLCRKGCKITRDGLGDLPKNVFVVKLLDLRKLSTTLSFTETPNDARQNLDEKICSCKSGGLHQLGKAVAQGVGVSRKCTENHCVTHPDEILNLYCIDCTCLTCSTCSVTRHGLHRCSDVSQVADRVRQQIRADTDSVSSKVTECRAMLQRLSDNETRFTQRLCKIEADIAVRAEEMKQAIETYKTQLFDKLTSAKKNQVKQFRSLRDELEGQLLMLESLMKYSDELASKGMVCEVVEAASGLHNRVGQLTELHYDDYYIVNSCFADLSFSEFASKSFAELLPRTFGELTVEEANNSKISLEEILSKSSTAPNVIRGNGSPVAGVTSVGDEVFVVRYKSNQIDVYDAATLNLRRRMSVCSSGQHRGVASCSINNCIYVSDYGNNSIYRVDIRSEEVAWWSVGSQPYGLSVNAECNVLVACYGANKLQEYTTDGTNVRKISLQSDIAHPLNVVQLSSGQYGITHAGSLHRYCVIDSDGKVINSYGSGNAPLLSHPFGLALSRRGTVFMTSYMNNMVVMLDSATFTASRLAVGGNLANPYCVHLDLARNRLYVGEWSGQKRVLILGN